MKTLYYNGTIITMENGPSPEAVLTKDGIITAIGSFSMLYKLAPDANIYNLYGHTLMPAFIDSHSHFSGYANSLLQVALGECASFDDISVEIKKFKEKKKIKPGEWIVGKGYDNNSLKENEHPCADLLDKICNENPIVIQHASGHSGVFNTAALKALNITNKTKAPNGGIIEQRNGMLTGYMEENAFFEYIKKVPSPNEAELTKAFLTAQEKYASYGIATIQEGMAVEQMIPLYKHLTENKMLMLDVIGYAAMPDKDKLFNAFKKSVKQYYNGFKLLGYKIFLDGSPQGRTAWMRTPYKGAEQNYFGYGTMNDKDVTAAMKETVENNMQLLAHCNGDAAAEQFISCATDVSGFNKTRPVMIHSQLLAPDQLDKVKKLNIIPSFFVAHVYYWGDTHIKNFGYERASKISPANSALKKSIPFTFHQDSPVVEPDMLKTIWCAVNRRTEHGNILGKEEAIPVYEALKAVTINAAYQYFEENEKGSIKKGKKADFVILDSNPLKVSPENICNIKIVETIKNDNTIYKKE